MKAAVCYEFGQPLLVEEVAINSPKAGEVKVKLAACAICHSDIHYAEGAWGVYGRLCISTTHRPCCTVSFF